MDSTTDLPKSQVKRIVKAKLNELYTGEEAHKRSLAISKDALTAFSESGRVFITHLTSAADEVCRNAKRSTVTGDDILQALRSIEFDEFVAPLTSLLEEFRAELKEKNRKRAENRLNKETTAAAQEKKEGAEAAPVRQEEKVEKTEEQQEHRINDAPEQETHGDAAAVARL